MQRKHLHIGGFILGIALIIAGFTAKSAHHSAEQTSLTSQLQPMYYPVSLADNAKINNYYAAKYVSYAAELPNYQKMSVSKEQSCSAQFALLNFEAYDLPEHILKVAMAAYQHARLLGLDKKQLLTVVDYQKPSDEHRLWVFDLNTDKMLFHTFVAHGAHSGRLYAKYFSNRINSLESSLGVILTGKSYPGIMGYSMRLHGLEQGFDNNIFKREIVMHPAPYVTRSFIRTHHEAGKSFGCLAVGQKIARSLINTIKNGSIIVNYFPNKNWLEHSKFLH